MQKDLQLSMMANLNTLKAQAEEVRKHKVNWQSYLQSQMITEQDYKIIYAYDREETADARQAILDQFKDDCAWTFMQLMTRISKEQTVRYVLTLVDDMLVESDNRCKLFYSINASRRLSMWTGFMNMLNREDLFIVHQASRILTKLACFGDEEMSSKDLTYFFNWIISKFSIENVDFLQSILASLQKLLRKKKYRLAFFEIDGGLPSLLDLLRPKSGFQIHYQSIVCIWTMSFMPYIANKMIKHNPVAYLADVLKGVQKDKVIRIVLATFRNLIEKPTEASVIKAYSLAMIGCKTLKHLERMEDKQFADDDITADVEFLNEHLQVCLQDVSSFDEYSSELQSMRLDWSPVHKSDKFWKENAVRLNEKNYFLLKILGELLQSSQDEVILAVALHDIGEYVRCYPRGKKILEDLNIKHLVMKLMVHDNSQVKYNALVTVQKLMVQNWEYLGKQLKEAEIF